MLQLYQKLIKHAYLWKDKYLMTCIYLTQFINTIICKLISARHWWVAMLLVFLFTTEDIQGLSSCSWGFWLLSLGPQGWTYPALDFQTSFILNLPIPTLYPECSGSGLWPDFPEGQDRFWHFLNHNCFHTQCECGYEDTIIPFFKWVGWHTSLLSEAPWSKTQM